MSAIWKLRVVRTASKTGEASQSVYVCVCVYTECDSSLSLLRNASISMNVETVGEHTVKFEDKALREGIVRMLKGNSSKPV